MHNTDLFEESCFFLDTRNQRYVQKLTNSYICQVRSVQQIAGEDCKNVRYSQSSN